jgi:hypothetical protein
MGADTRFQGIQRSPVVSKYWVLIAALGLSAAQLRARNPSPSATASAQAEKTADLSASGIKVLFLGDSLSLCGFGKRLDERLRRTPGVKAVFTYMACATQPLSWLKAYPYTNVKTRCGFWSIESAANSPDPKEGKDVYGMRRGWTPRAHPVPKLEDLLAELQPDVLILQTGGNLFDLFPDHKTVRPERDAAQVKKFIAPFVAKAISPPSSLKKIYWVAPPVSGRVSQQIQDFVVEEGRACFSRTATVIDSRSLISYPYRHLEPDHEHFIGEDMDIWADKVAEILSQDFSSQSIASMKPIRETGPQIAVANVTPAPQEAPENAELDVLARLKFKSKPMQVEEFLPYQESLVAFVYDVRKVLAGQYSEQQILVMHPAYIGSKRQSLRKYRIGRTYKLRLRELEGTPWDTVKRRDESDRIDLEPYIKVEDEAKYPGSTQAH